MKILVTGGAGFIGAHLVRRLLEDGHKVVLVDNLSPYYDPALKKSRLRHLAEGARAYKVDIAKRGELEEIFQNYSFDCIYHIAAQAGVRHSIENPFVYGNANYVGTLNILEIAKHCRVPRVVFASSSSVYGLNASPFREEMNTDTPVSVYAASKRACELLAFSYHRLFGLDITCLRFFTVYGPWGRPDMALFTFTKAMLKNEPIEVYNRGDMKRDFTYIDDIVDGLAAAIEKPKGFEIINLGRGVPVALSDFIEALEISLGVKANKNLLPMQEGDVKETHADIAKARELLGYEPKTDVRNGVKKFAKWYRGYYNL